MELTDQNFKQEVEESKGLFLVDFSAIWCGPCKLMAPVIEELIKDNENKENVKIGKVDIDNNKEISEKYNIMGIPTLILFKDGKIIEQITGYQSKEFLQNWIDKNL